MLILKSKKNKLRIDFLFVIWNLQKLEMSG